VNDHERPALRNRGLSYRQRRPETGWGPFAQPLKWRPGGIAPNQELSDLVAERQRIGLNATVGSAVKRDRARIQPQASTALYLQEPPIPESLDVED
jgi:hypothetical protein